jgi:xanthine dehydrogenase YagR molybdenum-binding subunit
VQLYQAAIPIQQENPVTIMASYIGTPVSRIDGHAKVTGGAKYAAEFNVPGLAHAGVVSSTIAKGRIVNIDAGEAMRVDGVIDVLTHQNRPPMANTDRAYQDDMGPEGGSPFRPLYDDKIAFSRQPIALVIAEEHEIAQFAASLVRVTYEEHEHVTDLFRRGNKIVPLKEPAAPRGNAEKAYATSDVRLEAEYIIPMEHHNPMELFASTAVWEDGKLTVYDKTQGVQNVQRYLCSVFGMKPDDVHVVSPFVGGAFGLGLRPQYEVALAVMAALALKRSVRLELTRHQMYALSYRPATIERLALGANAAGALNAITHEAFAMTSRYEDFSRNDTGWSGLLYKSANAKYSHKLAKLDLPTPSDMRAPGAATGVYALECAMDELAGVLKLDPLELRYRLYSDRDQNNDVPFTSKQLRECYRQGAQAFGWDKRNLEPRTIRDGSELVGWGMATGIWEAQQMKTTARIVLSGNGHAEVACGTSDIGTGTYTIMAQVAADMLGLPLDSVTIKLGDSTLPQSPVEGGSWMATSVSHAIAAAADEVRKELLRLAKKPADSPLRDVKVDDVVLVDGKITSKRDAQHSVPIADAMRYGAVDHIEKESSTDFTDDSTHARNTHSAIFVEVKVDEELGVIRVTRVVNAVAAGRILNPKTAGSQIIGGVVWGIGMALHEETQIDHALGRIMNANIAEYHVPVNADVHDIKVIFVDEPDATVNPLGIKGVGEIGFVGVAAAIANAAYHATGKRVRSLPITLDKLMRP